MRLGHHISPLHLVLGICLALAWTTNTASAKPLKKVGNLDGNYVGIGLIVNAVHMDARWDGAFGGEISLSRVRERQSLSVLGVAVGGMHFANDDNGRLWAELTVANRTVFGFTLGISGGVAVEVDELDPPRWGGHGTLWVFAGVIPYVRIGAVQNTGIFMDFGVKVTLPAFRW